MDVSQTCVGAGQVIASMAGQLLLAHEGAFGTFLLEGDVCELSLMFGRAGQYDAARYLQNRALVWAI